MNGSGTSTRSVYLLFFADPCMVTESPMRRGVVPDLVKSAIRRAGQAQRAPLPAARWAGLPTVLPGSTHENKCGGLLGCV